MKKFLAAMFIVAGLVASVAQAKDDKEKDTIDLCEFGIGPDCGN